MNAFAQPPVLPIGDVPEVHRLRRVEVRFGETRHADMMEQSIYNSIISGIGIEGSSWFYANLLQ